MEKLIEVDVKAIPPLPLGVPFVIQGVKRLPNGELVTDCRPGEETVFINTNNPT